MWSVKDVTAFKRKIRFRVNPESQLPKNVCSLNLLLNV